MRGESATAACLRELGVFRAVDGAHGRAKPLELRAVEKRRPVEDDRRCRRSRAASVPYRLPATVAEAHNREPAAVDLPPQGHVSHKGYQRARGPGQPSPTQPQSNGAPQAARRAS